MEKEDLDLSYIKHVAIGAAYQGAAALTPFFRQSLTIDFKGARDLVTEADQAAEKAILDTIAGRFPTHGHLAEESGAQNPEADHQWIIDPLDGTTNFAHGLGIFAVSVGFAVRGEVVVGVVLNPASGELFTATQQEAAQLNGRPILVSGAATLADSLLVTGFPYDYQDHLPALMRQFSACLLAARGVRRLGSAALDLCYVACGRFAGYWEKHLKPWDTAAGMLIARRAGATVSDFSGQDYTPHHPTLLATNGAIHEELRTLLRHTETDHAHL